MYIQLGIDFTFLIVNFKIKKKRHLEVKNGRYSKQKRRILNGNKGFWILGLFGFRAEVFEALETLTKFICALNRLFVKN